MEVSSEVWTGRNGQCTDTRNYGYGAEQGMRCKPTTHHGFNAGGDRDRADRAVARTPVCAIDSHEYDGHYPYASQSSKAGAFEHSECVTRDD